MPQRCISASRRNKPHGWAVRPGKTRAPAPLPGLFAFQGCGCPGPCLRRLVRASVAALALLHGDCRPALGVTQGTQKHAVICSRYGCGLQLINWAGEIPAFRHLLRPDFAAIGPRSYHWRQVFPGNKGKFRINILRKHGGFSVVFRGFFKKIFGAVKKIRGFRCPVLTRSYAVNVLLILPHSAHISASAAPQQAAFPP